MWLSDKMTLAIKLLARSPMLLMASGRERQQH